MTDDEASRTAPSDGAAAADDDFPADSPEELVRDVDLDLFLGRDPLRELAATSPARDVPTRPLLALRELLRRDDFAPLFARAVVAADPTFRTILPREPHAIIGRFVRAFDFLLTAVEDANEKPELIDQVVSFARRLGADHRKLELTERDYLSFGSALARTLRHLANTEWTDELASTLDAVYGSIATAMLQGAAAAPGPARVGATVVEVLRPCRDHVVVRLLTDEMLDYLPGQYLSVQTPYSPTHWRRLSPSIPSNPARQIEFHVRAVEGGATSGALARSVGPGDRWVLARPLGHLDVRREEAATADVLMIAGGTGVAPLRCLLADMLRFPTNPRVHLFVGARYPGELYALPLLVDIAASAPWLTIQPVAEEAEDPWWLRDDAAELPRSLHRIQHGQLVDVVTRYGNWADRQILVAGSPTMIRGTVAGLVAAGTPREAITFDPF